MTISEYIHFAEIILLQQTKQNKLNQDHKCSYSSTSIKAILREYKIRSTTCANLCGN